MGAFFDSFGESCGKFCFIYLRGGCPPTHIKCQNLGPELRKWVKIEEKIALCHVFRLELMASLGGTFGLFGGGAWKILLNFFEGGMPPYTYKVLELGART